MSLVVRLSPRKLVTVPPYGRKSVEAILLVDAASDDDDDNVGVEAGESVERDTSCVKMEVTNELGSGVLERAHITNTNSHRSVRSAAAALSVKGTGQITVYQEYTFWILWGQ